jgi:hypothetical protein
MFQGDMDAVDAAVVGVVEEEAAAEAGAEVTEVQGQVEAAVIQLVRDHTKTKTRLSKAIMIASAATTRRWLGEGLRGKNIEVKDNPSPLDCEVKSQCHIYISQYIYSKICVVQ